MRGRREFANTPLQGRYGRLRGHDRATFGAWFRLYPKDPSKPEIKFQYVSDGTTYYGQWVNVPVTFGVPLGWDGSGDYPTTRVEVFAVDTPTEFTKGMLGIGFGINGKADGGKERNPLLRLTYKGVNLSPGYTITLANIQIGLTADNTRGFRFINLTKNARGSDWMQPQSKAVLSDSEGDMPLLGDRPFPVDTHRHPPHRFFG